MVGSDDIVEDFEVETFLGFEEPVQVVRAIFGKAEQEFLFMASVGYVTGDKVTICSGHS
jgi:hypothetical protein